MDGLTRVTQRINTIEKRFMIPANPTSIGAFADVLAGAKQKSASTALNTNKQSIAKLVETSARQHGVDPKLALAVARTESGLETNSVSVAGAVGVMQLMPDTARSLGVQNITDPQENIDGGVRYLRKMLHTFNGDVVKAVAAYNAGPEAVKSYGGVPPYPETKSYVTKVMSQF
ncbi:MAG: lytic transglycosylase domain-containing protein [Veillonellaceae bacterium]|jgi:soluble lytic murein transglycosylase-like protein|nr:lytic transglycosylase domain-containing protein [Veillonellaceae bacterium]